MRWSLPAIQSLTAGYADASGYLALKGLFTAHVTGNFVTLGSSFVFGTAGALAKTLALPMFCAAVLLSRLLALRLKAAGRPAFRSLLWLQTLLLTVCAGLAAWLGPFADPDGALRTRPGHDAGRRHGHPERGSPGTSGARSAHDRHDGHDHADHAGPRRHDAGAAAVAGSRDARAFPAHDHGRRAVRTRLRAGSPAVRGSGQVVLLCAARSRSRHTVHARGYLACGRERLTRRQSPHASEDPRAQHGLGS